MVKRERKKSSEKSLTVLQTWWLWSQWWLELWGVGCSSGGHRGHSEPRSTWSHGNLLVPPVKIPEEVLAVANKSWALLTSQGPFPVGVWVVALLCRGREFNSLSEAGLGRLDQHLECPWWSKRGRALGPPCPSQALSIAQTIQLPDTAGQTCFSLISFKPYIHLPFCCFQLRRQNTHNDTR